MEQGGFYGKTVQWYGLLWGEMPAGRELLFSNSRSSTGHFQYSESSRDVKSIVISHSPPMGYEAGDAWAA